MLGGACLDRRYHRGQAGQLPVAALGQPKRIRIGQHPFGVGQVQFLDMNSGKRREDLSAETLRAIDDRVAEVVEEQRRRAEKIVRDHRKEIELVRDLLLEKKTIDAKSLGAVIPDNKNLAKPEADRNLPAVADPAVA